MKHQPLSISAIAALIIMSIFMSSCSRYYKAVNVPLKNEIETAMKIDSLYQAGRTLILRNETDAFLITNPVTVAGGNKIQCTLETLPEDNRLHLTKGIRGKMKYKKSGNTVTPPVLNEAHVYITADTTASASVGQYNIAAGNVQKIEILVKDKKRTTNSFVGGALITTISVLAICFAAFAISFKMDWGR